MTLYRGVAGVEPDRRERGLSWTLSREQALWFACWQAVHGTPAVLTCRVKRQHIYWATQERQEQECVVLLPRGVKITRTPVTEADLQAYAATHP